MSKSVKPEIFNESENGVQILMNVEDELEALELDASGMLDLLRMEAMAEEDKKEHAAGLYLLVGVQDHTVQSLRNIIETLESRIATEQKAEDADRNS